MRAEKFQYLLEIKRLGSISAAAKELNMKLNTLGAIVKSAEEELGYTIFRRMPQGISVTPEGERFMVLAQEIAVQYEQLLSLKKDSEMHVKPISLIMTPSINAGLSLPLTNKYYRFELHGDLMFEEDSRLNIAKRILNKDANIGLTYLTPAELQRYRSELPAQGIEIENLREDQFYLITAPDHPLARERVLFHTSLTNERIATVSTFCGDDSRVIPKPQDSQCDSYISFPNIAVMKQAILEQNMVGVLSGFTIMNDSNISSSELGIIPLGGDHHAYICLLHIAKPRLRYQERVLLTCITDFFRQMPPLQFTRRGGTQI